MIDDKIGIAKTIVIKTPSIFTKVLKEMFDKRCTWHFRDTILLTRGKLKDFTGVELATINHWVKYIDELKDGQIDLLVVELSHEDSENNMLHVKEWWEYK